MARKRPKPRLTRVSPRIIDPVKPRWMRITKLIAMIVLGAMMLIAIGGLVYRYLRYLSFIS